MTIYNAALGAGVSGHTATAIRAGASAEWDPELSTILIGTGVSSMASVVGGASRTVTQATGGNQPTINTTGLNGRPGLSFNGSSRYLSNSTPFLASLSVFSVLAIIKAPDQGDRRVICECSSTDGDPWLSVIQGKNVFPTTRLSAFIRDDAGEIKLGNTGPDGPVVFDNTIRLVGAIVNRATSKFQQFQFAEIDRADACDYGTITVNRFALGAAVGASAGSFLNGLLGPVLVLPYAVTAAHLRVMCDYYQQRGFLPSQPIRAITSAKPSNYTKRIFREDWSRFDAVSEIVEDGMAATVGKPYACNFVQFGVDQLEGNNDRCIKRLASYAGSGGASLASLGIQPHYLNPNGKLGLAIYEIPAPNRAAFGDFEHAGGMISSERSFSYQGESWWEARLRILHNPPGGHFAVWLLTAFTAPHHVELDLLEHIGNTTFTGAKPYNVMHCGGHDQQEEPPRSLDPTINLVSNFQAGLWHTFAVHAHPTTFKWYLDGVQTREEPAYFNFDASLYWLLSWESNFEDWNDFPGPSNGFNPTYPGLVEIDYLETWAPA